MGGCKHKKNNIKLLLTKDKKKLEIKDKLRG